MMTRKQALKFAKAICAEDSNRVINEFNHLKAKESVLTSESVDQYLGSELPDIPGIDKNKIYNVYRPGNELKKSLESYNDLPLTDEHYFVDGVAVHKSKWIGGVGSKATFKDGKVFNTVAIWDKDIVPLIEDNQKVDLSCGYKFSLVPESGMFNGKYYDYKMADIVVNHVALVKVGRNAAAQVADTDLINKEKSSMKFKPDELLAHIQKTNPQVIADSEAAMAAIKEGKTPEDDCTKDKAAKKEAKLAKKMAKKEAKMKDKEPKEEPKEKAMTGDDITKLVGDKVVEYNSTKSLCEKVLGKSKVEFAVDALPMQMINETLKIKNVTLADSVSDEAKMVLVKYIADTAPAVEPKRESVIRVSAGDSYAASSEAEYKSQF